jgi:23S rRNA (guanosine2251-2'-O)-methyltransferase
MKSRSHHKRSKPSHHKNRSRSGDSSYLDKIVYGKNPVFEMLKARRREVFEILGTEESLSELQKSMNEAGLNFDPRSCQVVKRQDLDDKLRGAVHQGVMAKTAGYPYEGLENLRSQMKTKEKSLVLALDSIQDPQNLGALARSALAFGVNAIIIPKDRSAGVNATVVKASAGATEHLKIIQVTNLVQSFSEFKENGYWIYGTHLTESSVDLEKVDPPAKSVLVMGSEGKGLRQLVAKNCDQLVKIPMSSGWDSLNVAQAGTVALYHFRQV